MFYEFRRFSGHRKCSMSSLVGLVVIEDVLEVLQEVLAVIEHVLHFLL